MGQSLAAQVRARHRNGRKWIQVYTGTDPMQRVTITVDDELMLELDRIIAARGYQNRSEAIRDLARAGIRQAAETLDKQRDCVAALVYVYDHNARQLSKRLVQN